MTTNVETHARFKRDIKRLGRKYPTVIDEVAQLMSQLEIDERPGDKIPDVGYDVYKVRLRNPSAKKGKRGGFRVVYYVQLADHVFLITIYAKSEQTDIAPDVLRSLIESLEQDIE